MASKVTQIDQNGPTWVQSVQNGSKRGPKKGSHNGSPRGRNQKKVEKYFFSGLGASNESENVQKSAQNGSKMAQKWPRRALYGTQARPFEAILGPFLDIFSLI